MIKLRDLERLYLLPASYIPVLRATRADPMIAPSQKASL
jgi:hypothetical protein